ncbi:MAG: hypothetical protein FJ146_13655 [Deltaproteobacteria bacterium]|nr:hypothetical protein [Deltaproteobacteria bacterium]
MNLKIFKPPKHFKRALVGLLGVLFLMPAAAAQAENYSLSYAARLTTANGAPVDGPVDVEARFWTAATGGSQLARAFTYAGVTPNQGVLQITIVATSAEIAQIFGDGSAPVYIEVTAAGKIYGFH